MIQGKLSEIFAAELTESWRLEADSSDPLSLIFHFPSVLPKESFGYIMPSVKLEFGTRADTWPSYQRQLSSYVFESLPDVIAGDLPFIIPVLSAERTFWEKATILHAEYHRPESKPGQFRIARHYYDLYCLAASFHGENALGNLNLLERVVRHKTLFFRTGWANYSEARPGTLRLLPKEPRLKQLRSDYALMREMFFQDPPDFFEVVRGLVELEKRINGG